MMTRAQFSPRVTRTIQMMAMKPHDDEGTIFTKGDLYYLDAGNEAP